MKSSWAQPSLSREFALLSVAILFILFMVSLWVSYITYESYADKVVQDLESEAQLIDHSLISEIQNANYLLNSLGRQITLSSATDSTAIAGLLKAFDSRTQVYHVFLWTNNRQEVEISSAKGIIETPVDVSDRDYIKKSLADPWKMQIGRPIEGRVSNRWVIPAAVGLTDFTGKFLGTLSLSMDIHDLSDQIAELIRRPGISFAITSQTLIPLTQVSNEENFVARHFPVDKMSAINFYKHPKGVISRASLFGGSENFAYYQVSKQYPYLILLGFDGKQTDMAVRRVLWPKLVQISVVAFFLISFLWIVRARIISPVVQLTDVAASVARGESFRLLPKGGPTEILNLSYQIKRISDFLTERNLMEDELRNKMFMLRKAKERAEVSNRSKSDFLAYVSSELKNPINGIVGFAQVMKDQLYGPIENKKYRQYASDIYKTGSDLLSLVHDVHMLARSETDMLELHEKPLDIAALITKSQRFLAEKMQTEKLSLQVKAPDSLPRLLGDEFCIQQALINLLHFIAKRSLPGEVMACEARVITEDRDSPFIAILLASDEAILPENADVLETSRRILPPQPSHQYKHAGDLDAPSEDMNVLLARILLYHHRANFTLDYPTESSTRIVICFPHNRLLQKDDKA